MMFEVMGFKFCPIHIKHQTFHFKLKKRGRPIKFFYLMGLPLFLHLLQQAFGGELVGDEDVGVASF